MNVHGTENQQPWIHAKTKQAEQQRTAPVESETPPPAAGDTEGTKGVLRLLQEGHFRGVADVRLRINFHDELQRSASQNAVAAFADSTPGLLDELAEKTRILGEEHGLAAQGEQLAASFANEVKQLLEDAKAGQTPLSTTLEDMNVSFSTFLASLQSAFEEASTSATPAEPVAMDPEAVELPAAEEALNGDMPQPVQMTTSTAAGEAEEPVEEFVESEDPVAASFYAALNELEAWFSESLTSLSAAAAASQELPPLSEPRGNGKAYSRFLEIYQELNAGTVSAAADESFAGELSVEA